MLQRVLADRIRERGLSKRAAAREIGVAHTTLIRILEGANADMDTIMKISDWLKIPMSTLINAEQSDLASKIAVLIDKNPELGDVFVKAITEVIEGNISTDIIEDIASYTIFKINSQKST